jgi:hypothetical protein
VKLIGEVLLSEEEMSEWQKWARLEVAGLWCLL